MADAKISELPLAAALDGTEPVPIVQGSVTVQTTTQDIANLGGSGSGTVTSVAMTGDGVIFNGTVSGSPITNSGTLAPALLTQTKNLVLAGPTTGANAAPTFRSLVASDLPSVALTSGHIFVGNASNIAADVTMSGDISINNAGATTLNNTAVTPGSYTSTNITVDSTGRITAASNGGNAGTVTSVAMTGDGVIYNSSVTGSPITSSGTLVPSLKTQTANKILAGPTTGSAAAATFRSLIGADLPNPSSSTLGGVNSHAAVSHQFLTQIGTDGSITGAQPAAADLSDGTSGSGAVALVNSPVFTTPNIGSATGSISGNSATATALQNARNINGVSFNGTADITVAAAAGTLTGTTLASNVVNSSLTSVGTLTGGATGAGFTVALAASTISGILGSANGGTANGFTKFSGAATSEKTYTLPNATCNVLTDNAAVTAAQGGTGLASYTQGDLVYASASTTISKLAKDTNATRYLSNQGTTNNPSWNQVNLANGVTGNLPVTNLNSGTSASSSTYWRGDGTWAGVSTTPNIVHSVSNNPTGSSDATGKMMGLAVAFTPVSTGYMKVTITGNINFPSNDGGTGSVRAYFGTSTAPTNGAALTGTALGSKKNYNTNGLTAPNGIGAFACIDYVSGLTLATAYWIDAAVTNASGQTTNITNVDVVVEEVK